MDGICTSIQYCGFLAYIMLSVEMSSESRVIRISYTNIWVNAKWDVSCSGKCAIPHLGRSIVPV